MNTDEILEAILQRLAHVSPEGADVCARCKQPITDENEGGYCPASRGFKEVIARACGVSRTLVENWISGKAIIPARHVPTIQPLLCDHTDIYISRIGGNAPDAGFIGDALAGKDTGVEFTCRQCGARLPQEVR